MDEARQRERQLKGLNQAKKDVLVTSLNPERRDLFDELLPTRSTGLKSSRSLATLGIVSCAFAPETNSESDKKFVMPIGILQYLFCDLRAPNLVNLRAVGAFIAHSRKLNEFSLVEII